MAAASFSLLRRAGYAVVSGLCGWLAGQVACLPVNVIIAVRDSEGDAKVFVQTLVYGLLAWGLWTLALAALAWVLVTLPLVLTMRPCLVVRLRYGLTALAVLLSISLTGIRPAMFHDTSAISFFHKYAEVIPYGAFALAFTLVTAVMYIALAKRRLAQAEADA